MKIGIFNTETIINESDSGSVTFLIGKNGSGKSRCLGQIRTDLYLSRDENIIAISNSAVSKFPSKNNYRHANYKLFNPTSITHKPSEIVKK